MQDKTLNLLRIIFLKIGLMIFMKVITISDDEVTLTPSTQIITEKSQVTLTYSYTGSLTVTNYTMISASQSQNSVLVGSLLTDCNVSKKQPDSALFKYTCPSNRQLSWTIKNVTRANEGDLWKCLLRFTSVGSEQANITINVQVPIQNIVMTIPTNNVVTVQEKTETAFICKTSGGLPAATVRWYKDNGPTTDDMEVTSFATTTLSTIDKLRSVTSTLRYSPRKGDNGMRIYCIARNSANTLTSSRKPKLNVQYSPDGPPTIQNFNNGSTCYVIENIQRTLSCSINGGNPLATLSWTCFNSGHASTTIGSTVTKPTTFTISRRQDKTCACKSSHPIAGIQSVTLNVQVLYPPESPAFKVNGKIASGTITFIEGKTRTVDCESWKAKARYLYLDQRKSNYYNWKDADIK